MATENGEVEGPNLDSTRSPKQDNYTSSTSELRKRPLPASDDAQFTLDFDDQRELSTAERFEIFERDNPHVKERLSEMSLEWYARTGGQRLGIRTLWEAMRYDVGLRTRSADFKLNDHYTSFYVRLIVLEHPELADMFEMRRSHEADTWIASRRAA